MPWFFLSVEGPSSTGVKYYYKDHEFNFNDPNKYKFDIENVHIMG